MIEFTFKTRNGHITERATAPKARRAYAMALDEAKGTFTIRQTGHEYVVEELRNGTWTIIESLPTLNLADIAYHDYSRDGHNITWRF